MNNIYITDWAESVVVSDHTEIKLISNGEFTHSGEADSGSSFFAVENGKLQQP